MRGRFYGVFKTALGRLQREADTELSGKISRRGFDIVASSVDASVQFSGKSKCGDDILRDIRSRFKTIPTPPSEMQRVFLESFLRACAPKFYGDQWDSEYGRIMAENGWKEQKSFFMAITPRRFGKTFSVAMFVACVALEADGMTTAIFSTGRRVSRMLLVLIRKMLNSMEPNIHARIDTANQEELFVRSKSGRSLTKIFSYPAKDTVTHTKRKKRDCARTRIKNVVERGG